MIPTTASLMPRFRTSRESLYSIDKNKVYSSNVQTRLTGCGLKHFLFYSLFDQSGVEMPLSRPARHQHDLRQNHQEGSFNNPLPFFVDVNIAKTSNTSNTYFPSKISWSTWLWSAVTAMVRLSSVGAMSPGSTKKVTR